MYEWDLLYGREWRFWLLVFVVSFAVGMVVAAMWTL